MRTCSVRQVTAPARPPAAFERLGSSLCRFSPWMPCAPTANNAMAPTIARRATTSGVGRDGGMDGGLSAVGRLSRFVSRVLSSVDALEHVHHGQIPLVTGVLEYLIVVVLRERDIHGPRPRECVLILERHFVLEGVGTDPSEAFDEAL